MKQDMKMLVSAKLHSPLTFQSRFVVFSEMKLTIGWAALHSCPPQDASTFHIAPSSGQKIQTNVYIPFSLSCTPFFMLIGES